MANANDSKTKYTDEPVLTYREVEVALQLGTTKTCETIAEDMGLNFETVRSIIDRIRDKTNYRRRLELVMWVTKKNEWLSRELIRLKPSAKTVKMHRRKSALRSAVSMLRH